jgi:hypothetical protein
LNSDIEGILGMMTEDVVFEASFGKDPWDETRHVARAILAAKRSYRKGRI